mmetsp:Transcript_6446/g.11876  ORF Transcript_6446/g.11876 Transcript_6446/m.11876 type:complete len:391 (-) Transcript_6446:297-1469(-)|eukprot:CAMPEP_0197520420 /NCGR_PEP_ID=MMETSP1318-20131121/5770_1 /TAXON_ID=552666 /ORGANISM="Partenskyella glossopodia, Strain RCC365" /LENGTH=390 /DNA_ID=CAMNT_0043071975 /DNA_START=147 /DNA_END=1319 /DNA_ORIENTATION=-
MSVESSPLMEGSTAASLPVALTPEIMAMPHPLAAPSEPIALEPALISEAKGDKDVPEILGRKLQEFFQTSLRTVHSQLGDRKGGSASAILPGTPSSTPSMVLPPPKPKRRKGIDLAEHEKWYCPFRCGKFYRKTSTRSIRRHRNECAFHISVREALAPAPAGSPPGTSIASSPEPKALALVSSDGKARSVAAAAQYPSRSPLIAAIRPPSSVKRMGGGGVEPMQPQQLPSPLIGAVSMKISPATSPQASPENKMPIHKALQVFLLKSLEEKKLGKLSVGKRADGTSAGLSVDCNADATSSSSKTNSLSPSASDKGSTESEDQDSLARNLEGSPVQHLEKMLPQERLLKLLEKENKWMAADAKLRARHHSLRLPPPLVATTDGGRHRQTKG